MKEFIATIAFIILITVIGLLCWQIDRKIHYRFAYRDMVQDEIRKMVKVEALK